jgi:hypothetical protein
MDRSRLFFGMPATTAGFRKTWRNTMKSSFVRPKAAVLGAASALILLVACDDKRLSQLDTGITRDSAVTVLAQSIRGGGSDSFPNVYTRDRFLIGGKNYEVLYFTPNNEKGARKDTAWKALTPIVFVEGKLVAKGWPGWDSIATANKIPLKKR